MDELQIVLLDKAHNREGFDCGVEPLNAFLRQHALQNMRKHFNVTNVLVNDGDAEILAYYSWSTGQIKREDVPVEVLKALPRYPAVPSIRLGRLAVDVHFRGKGYGDMMLSDVLTKAAVISGALGVHAIEVDALNESARAFYRKYGFQALEDNPSHLYLQIATVKQAMGMM